MKTEKPDMPVNFISIIYIYIFSSKNLFTFLSIPFTERMKDNGQDVLFMAYENERHTFMREENLNDMYGKIIRFLTDES